MSTSVRNIRLHCARNMRFSAFFTLYRNLVLVESQAGASSPMRKIWRPNKCWQTFNGPVRLAHSTESP